MTTELKRGFLEDAIKRISSSIEIPEKDRFIYWFYSLLFDVDVDDIPPDEIVDGTGERQIDVFRVDIDESKPSADVFIIQLKETNGFGANTVSLIKAGLDFTFKLKKDDYETIYNKKLVEKISEVRDAISQFGNNSINVTCLYVTLGDEADISDEAKQNARSIINEYELSQVFNSFEFRFIGVHELDRLVNLRLNKKRVIDYDLPIVYDANRASIVEFDSGGIGSLLCTISGIELARLAQSEPRDAVFDANVRGNLGLGGQVNKSIYESASDQGKAANFWFMNNGITMVCDDFSLVRDPDNPKVKIQNLQIINGCQTTSSVRSAFEDKMLSDKVRLQLKLYSSKDPEFVDNVVIATNNQNSINTRDLHANDEVQILIQRKIKEDFGLFYERKRGEAKSEGVPKSQTISMEKAGQAYLAVFLMQPTISRAQKYKIYSNELYDRVFGKARPWQLAVAHELYKYAEVRGRRAYRELDDSNPSRNILNYGVFHIARVLWWVLGREGRVDINNHKGIIELCQTEADPITAAYESSCKIVENIVDENNENMINLNNYFKKSLSQDHINKHLKSLSQEPDGPSGNA